MDFRIREDGQVFVLEANANPNLAANDEFALSALSMGIGYPELLKRIIALGLAYKAEWRAGYA
jgi:D-alanine-D-alanine ligase